MKGSRRRLQSPIRAGKIVPFPVTHRSIANRSSGSRGSRVGHGVAFAWTFRTDDFHARQSARESARSSAGPFPMAHAGSSSALRRGGGGIGLCGADVSNANGCWATFLVLSSLSSCRVSTTQHALTCSSQSSAVLRRTVTCYLPRSDPQCRGSKTEEEADQERDDEEKAV